jgi:hypothetical protein
VNPVSNPPALPGGGAFLLSKFFTAYCLKVSPFLKLPYKSMTFHRRHENCCQSIGILVQTVFEHCVKIFGFLQCENGLI